MTTQLRLAQFVDQEDTRKLHAEINQLSNQRFLLLTLALTVMATALGLLFTRDPAVETEMITGYGIVLVVFVGLIMLLASTLRHVSRCEATYLVAASLSNWES
jgi:hypothetical protein